MVIFFSMFMLGVLWGVQPYDFDCRREETSSDAWFSVVSDKIALIMPDKDSERPESLLKEGGPLEACAQDLLESAADAPNHAKGGWCSRLWSGLKRWWQEASWAKRIAWVTVGSTVAVGVGVVWLNGGYYLVFKSVKDYVTHFGVNHAPGELLISGTGMVLSPTSSEVATATLASAVGATATTTLTPTQTPTLMPTQTPTPRPPLDAGRCDLVEGIEQYRVVAGCPSGSYNGLCVTHAYGCAYNGDYLYAVNGDEIICRCKRACNAPPKDLPCYFYSAETRAIDNCTHVPLCDTCRPLWCRVCNGWIPEAVNISDPSPSYSDVRAWLIYHGISLTHWWRDNSCCCHYT